MTPRQRIRRTPHAELLAALHAARLPFTEPHANALGLCLVEAAKLTALFAAIDRLLAGLERKR